MNACSANVRCQLSIVYEDLVLYNKQEGATVFIIRWSGSLVVLATVIGL